MHVPSRRNAHADVRKLRGVARAAARAASEVREGSLDEYDLPPDAALDLLPTLVRVLFPRDCGRCSEVRRLLSDF